ncbi:MAG: M3 family oligoendopeptidase [Candidatus Promineifilaceae bacterium]
MTETSYTPGPWSLADLFPAFASPEIAAAAERLQAQLAAFETYRHQLAAGLDPAAFGPILAAYEAIVRAVARLTGYAGLRFSADTQDQQAQANLARYRQLAAETQNRTLFFELWWKGLDDAAAAPLLAAAGDFRYWLEALRHERPFTLSEPVEQVINLKDVNGSAALLTLLSTLTDRYTFSLRRAGREEKLTREELSAHFRSPDADLRAAAYQELFRVYAQDTPLLGQIYQARLRDWHSENVGLRGFASPISVRNLANDIPDEVVELLLDVCRANAAVFQDYFRLKAGWLGLDKLRRYDLYAPLAESEQRFPFDDAVRLVLDSFARFDPRLAELAGRVIHEGHLDSESRPGKRGGAFCATVTPDLTPWVLQSYTGRARDVATLAHELGHAVHSLLAADHTALTQHASLPLAETASTFGEMLVLDRLLAAEPDPAGRRSLLAQQMDDNYATIMRQAYFALFEREAHACVRDGGATDDLTRLYAANLAHQFGDALDLSDDFNLEWLVIPHIYQAPFYVYAYAFGQLLVLSLYRQYQAEGPAFKPRYLELLAAGGADAPARILERAGIDIGAADFWQGGFDILRDALGRLRGHHSPLPSGERGQG